jgi:AcrR family transcriptional regulator
VIHSPIFHIERSDIKKKRVIKLFIEAAADIIDEEGIEAVTIRKVGERTGYNSATIYSYFGNLRQLVFLAAAASLGDYVSAMPSYISSGKNALEQFLLMWECFCRYSFQKPKVYYSIFSDDIGIQPEALVSQYYELFPEELADAPKDLHPMLKETDLKRRNMLAISRCTRAGCFDTDDEAAVEEAIRLVYQGMLTLFLNHRVHYTVEDAVERTMSYIRKLVEVYSIL